MKILFITPSIPSRLHRIRAYHLIKYLSRSHKIYLLSLLPSGQEKYSLQKLASYCQEIVVVPHSLKQSVSTSLLSLPTSVPLEVAYCQSSAMKNELRALVKSVSPDLIYVKRLRMLTNVLGIVDVPVILDTTDAMSLYYQEALRTVPLYKKALYFNEWYKYFSYERAASKRFKEWVVCSPSDQEYLQQLSEGKANIHLIPNGVDTEYYDFNLEDRDQHPTIIFSGLMNKHVNVSAILFFENKIFPLIQKLVPEVQLLVVGPNPARSVKKLDRHPSTSVLGYVEDIRPFINRSHTVICPMLTGTGTRNKILQAWALGTPVVSTELGVSGLSFGDEEDLLIGETPHKFAMQVARVLQDQSLSHQLSARARRTVTMNYSMNTVSIKLNHLLDRMVKNS